MFENMLIHWWVNIGDKCLKVTKLGVSNLVLPEIYICSRVHLAHVEYEIGIPIKRGFHFYWFWIERPSSPTQRQGSCMKFMTVFMGYTWAEVFNPFFKKEKIQNCTVTEITMHIFLETTFEKLLSKSVLFC